MKKNVEFCSGCVVRAFHSEEQTTFETKQKFLKELNESLATSGEEVAWSLSFTSCQRYCPEGKISTLIERQMRMSPASRLEDLALFLNSNIKQFDPK